MITITTPTGNIGRRLIERLAFAGKPLTIVARHPEKLPRSLREREIVRQASSDDAAALSRATEGTDVLFWLTPPNFASPNVRASYRKAADAVSRAVRINRIPRIVNLSSIGASWADGLGPISGLHDVERALNDAADDVFHLRHVPFSLWSETNPEGRWRCFAYEELEKRDKLNLDIFWIKVKSLEDADSLPEPDVLAQEIADDLETALELFGAIANELKE
jgi:hypothetical protein